MNDIEYTKHIFKHYFRLIAERTGATNWDSDNDAEIDAAIETLINYCLKMVKEGGANNE